MTHKKFKLDLAGRELTAEVGQLAQQTNGSVVVSYGQTVILATAVLDKDLRDVDYMPLTVDYEEKFYAAGKIKSGRFLKREGRPSDEAVLTGRMVDRTIRPLFDKRIRNDLQVVLTVLSFDKENDPDIPALIAASLALGISDIPWNGPVAGLRIGRHNQEWALNPTYQLREKSDLDLVVAGKEDKINMLEGGAKQVPEKDVLSAIEFGQPYLKKIIQWQKEIIKEVGLDKADLELKEFDSELVAQVRDWLKDKLEKTIYNPDKVERSKGLFVLEKELIADLDNEQGENERVIRDIFEQEVDRVVHQNILKAPAGKEKRPDGRALDQVRPINCQVSLLPRTHGSALFERGETQALSVVTLGSPGDNQMIDNMEVETKKYFMHHYNFPGFCVGETGGLRGPGRRDIGHGALAEKALLPLIPDREKFPYTIRLVSEILSSNGSSSMASVSGSSLSLMSAGVPIETHVTGIAMGLMMESEDNYRILTDIQGPEDHHGDMDCKVAGTKKGVTACQMDVKIEGVTLEILKKAFVQARAARLSILEKMEQAIKASNSKLSPFAPRILTLKIDQDKIGKVIGPGGKIINEIVEQTGAKIDIEDDGLISITSADEESGQKALAWVKSLTREPKVGEIFQGTVVKIADFGAFVEILPGHDGLLHISELSDHRVNQVEDFVKLGQVLPVKVKEIDDTGRIKLTLKNIKT